VAGEELGREEPLDEVVVAAVSLAPREASRADLGVLGERTGAFRLHETLNFGSSLVGSRLSPLLYAPKSSRRS
jgi:hypothetical protein